MYELSI
jgi:hypothetical protein